MTWLLVALGAAAGAPLRYLVDRALPSVSGTLAVNVAGSGLLGVLAGSAAHDGASADLLLLAGTGFCGALTTYSTFSFEAVRLAEAGRARVAACYVVVSIAAGLAAAAAGVAVGAHIF